MKQSGCLECYTKVKCSLGLLAAFHASCEYVQPLPVFLQGLEVLVQRELLLSGVRQYIHRMIICLGDELLKYVPMAISLMLKDCTVSKQYYKIRDFTISNYFVQARDLQEFIPLINQLISKYKERISSMLQEIFLPVCQTIFICISQPSDPSDTEVLLFTTCIRLHTSNVAELLMILTFYSTRNKEIG